MPWAVAAAIAVLLARRGHAVHLSTTDPAAHVAQTLDGQVAGLTVSRIDPAAETAAYQQEVLGNPGAQMDAAGRSLLEERSVQRPAQAYFETVLEKLKKSHLGFQLNELSNERMDEILVKEMEESAQEKTAAIEEMERRQVCLPYPHLSSPILTYPHACSCMLTYAHVCSRMLRASATTRRPTCLRMSRS